MKESTDTYPLVSVLMTAYNREKYIAEAIESVLASTYKNFELVIVDDCSGDKTVEIAQKYEQQDSRISVYVNEKNIGDYPNRNRATKYSKGEYLMFVDSDDTILPGGIKSCIDLMKKFPAAGFGINFKDLAEVPQSISSEVSVRKHFFEKPFLLIGPGGTILKRDFFFKIGQYPTQYGPANDMYFNLKAANSGELVLLPFEFMYYRIHEGQQLNNDYSYLYNNYRYLKDALKEIPFKLTPKEVHWLEKKNKRRFVVNLCKYFLRTGDLRKTKQAIHLASFKLSDAYEGLFHLD